MGHIIEQLRNEVESRHNQSTDGRHFISQHEIKALCTRTVIEEAVRECVQEYPVPDHQEKVVVQRIFTEGKIDKNIGPDFANNVQWKFLPRTLTKEMSGYHCSFRDEEILPFIAETRLGEGNFGDVFKMLVLPSLQTIFPDQSFGCIVSEIVAYIKDGPDGVKRFRDHRLGAAFRANVKDHYFFTGQDLRPQVTSWLKRIAETSESRVFRGLLEAVGLMLKINPKERPMAAKVHQHLSFLSVEVVFNAVQRPLAAASEILSDKANYFNHILTTLLEKSNLDIRMEEAVSPSEVAYSIGKPFHEKLQGLIEKLWQSHPAVQREQLMQTWLVESLDRSSLDRSQEGLHDIESGKLSSQYSEFGDLASTKQGILRLTNDDNQDAEILKSEARSLKLNSDILQIESHFSEGLSIDRYNDKQVFVETISHMAHWDDMSEHRRA
ncbi:hypothetical protein BDD12DRAFT_884550 [Trichophaea hybrida]|nr:hypothetical protein BDD12DRAFT_884550 [Trichophaea hybrida]